MVVVVVVVVVVVGGDCLFVSSRFNRLSSANYRLEGCGSVE